MQSVSFRCVAVAVMCAGSSAAQAAQSDATARTVATSPTGDIHDFDYFEGARAPIDQQPTRPFTGAEAIEMGVGHLNGSGNVYRIPIEAVLSATGSKGTP